MSGRTVLHYAIEKKLGAGGMGEVFLATDTRLDRKVALKFLPEALSQNAQARERLIREARAASRLNHPSIVTIHAVEEVNGRHFIVMEYVEGRVLSEFAGHEDLSLAKILDLAVPLADALRKAHDAGIVHRDLKPANILVDADGRPRILDFGLAKVRGAARLTQTGSTLGTIAYTSPEQAQGQDADERSDLYSFGTLLYELVTGQLPFKGEHEVAMLYAIVHDEPPPVSRFRSDLPADLVTLILSCLSKRPENRPASAAAVVNELTGLRQRLVSGPTAVLAETGESHVSIAVLPFANMSADAEQEYFCDGIAEDIINHLSHIQDLHVAARTSTFAFKGRNEDVREIGRRLGVGHVVEGSVRKAGNRVRINAQLIKVADGYHLWSDRFDRELSDIFAVQDEISQSIADALQIKLTDRERQALQKSGTRDIDAYDLYLRGRRLSRRYGRQAQLAMEMFLKAINLDPRYAQAYAGAADLYAIRFLYMSGNAFDLNEAVRYSRRALELDADLAEAHAAYGHALSLNKEYGQADREFEIAQRLNPKLYEAYYYHGRTHFLRGNLDRAAELFEQAAAADPEDYQALCMAITAYRGMHDLSGSTATARRVLEIIDRHLDQHPGDARAVYLGAGAHFDLGHREEAIEWAERALAIDPSDPGSGVLYNVACLFSKTGEIDRAIELLDQARLQGFAIASWIEHDADFDPIREDPRFQKILAQIRERVESSS